MSGLRRCFSFPSHVILGKRRTAIRKEGTSWAGPLPPLSRRAPRTDLTVPLGFRRDVAAESHAGLGGKLHDSRVRHRQGPRLAETDWTDVRVGAVGTVQGAAGAVRLDGRELQGGRGAGGNTERGEGGGGRGKSGQRKKKTQRVLTKSEVRVGSLVRAQRCWQEWLPRPTAGF